MTYDPSVLYSLLVTSPDAPGRMGGALGGIFGVPGDRVDVSETGEWDERDWDAPVSCEYGRLHGELSWSFLIYATEGVAQPPEDELALALARLLDCVVLFPGKETLPSMWLAATPDGRVTRVEAEEPEDEDGPWHIRAAEDSVAAFPEARVGPFRGPGGSSGGRGPGPRTE